MADDGQISCKNSWKKLRISNISTNMRIWGCAHYYTSAIYLAWITMKKTNHTILSFQTSVPTYPTLPEQLFKLEILRGYLGAMAANLRMSHYPDFDVEEIECYYSTPKQTNFPQGEESELL